MASDERPGGPPSGRLIEGVGLSAGHGTLAVVRDLDLHVDAGEVVALLGPNGAGKTTTLLTLAGELPPLAGEVRFRGEATTAPMHARCRAGLSFVTEERSVIMGLTAHENLRLAGVAPATAVELFPELAPLMKRPAGLLSGGEQQMLTLARALGRNASVATRRSLGRLGRRRGGWHGVLLADELSLGLAPIVVDRLLTAVRRAADERGVGVLLVEQHVRQALRVADRVVLLERGRVARTGPVAEVRERLEAVEAAYLSAAGT